MAEFGNWIARTFGIYLIMNNNSFHKINKMSGACEHRLANPHKIVFCGCYDDDSDYVYECENCGGEDCRDGCVNDNFFD